MSSPYSSRENVQSPLQSPSIAGSPMSSVYQTSRKSSQTSTSGLSGKILIFVCLWKKYYAMCNLQNNNII